MRSMTGYGRASAQDERFVVQVELRSVNSRFLDLRPKLARPLSFFEPRLRELLSGAFQRGAVEAQVSLQAHGVNAAGSIDKELLGFYAKELNALSAQLQIPSGADVLGLLRLPGTVAATDAVAPEQEAKIAALAEQAAKLALEELKRTRAAEGENLRTFLRRELTALEELQKRVNESSPQLAEQARRRLQERLTKTLSELSLQVDQSRLAQEVVFYTDRSDVTEELDRLSSHCKSFGKLLDGKTESALGKRLDFMLQEMGREVNTLGSKSDSLGTSQSVLDMKLVVERLREQVQNVE